MDLHQIARRLDGTVIGRRTLAIPTPGHSRRDRGTSLTFDSAAPGGFLVHSFNGGDPLAIKAMVAAALGRSAFRPDNRTPARDSSGRAELAMELWRAARPARGTIVETYLAGRGLHLPPDTSELRFLETCPFGRERHPAMLALMRNIVTNAPQAVHRTALKPDGSGKAVMADGGQAKRMLGPAAGAVVKLCPDEDVTLGLGIAEGIENALTAICGGWRPVWAAGSAGAVASFPVLGGVEALTIFADPEPTGVAAARRCAGRWQEAGREATVIRPHGNLDWNERSLG
jgi:hypothetical protein